MAVQEYNGVQKYDISIIDEDIQSGEPKNPHKCPLVNAVRRIVPDVAEVSVHNTVMHIEYKNETKEDVVIAGDIGDRIANYDETGEMEPVTLHWSHPFLSDPATSRVTRPLPAS